MTLGFSQEINGKPTYFPEKIWASLLTEQIVSAECIMEYARKSFPYLLEETFSDDLCYIDTLMPYLSQVNPKHHTIRADDDDRWPPKTGLIHPVINNRTPRRFQFAPTLECKSVQKITIKWFEAKHPIETREHVYNPREGLFAVIHIDGRNYPLHTDQRLFVNDGFEDQADFFAWFNSDFTGKIIHWSDLKY